MPRAASPAALILGGAGLIPFLGLAALVILGLVAHAVLDRRAQERALARLAQEPTPRGRR